MRPPADWRLCLVTDRRLAAPRPLEDVVMAAVRGGVTAVQLREKECPTREFVALARRLKSSLAPLAIPLIINDRVDVALAAGADGVHVGQSDMEYRDVRRLVGPDFIVGLSVETLAHALQASSFDADYLGVGPIFSTPTKADAAPACGTGLLTALRARSRHVLVAIGGINRENVRQVIDAGAAGVAVVSAICAAPDPKAAARELRNIIDGKIRPNAPLV